MALMRSRQTGRAAFTLVELLVVIGIMAVLATISVTGYTAATRGMADRGVIQTTVSILRIAQQTCKMERVPTKVLFYNQRLTEDADEDDATLYQGTAIAIKQAGRITMKPSSVGGLLIDEFADWHQSYPMAGAPNALGMRFYRMTDDDKNKDIEACSVMVQPFVTHYQLKDYMIEAGMTIDQWCRSHGRTAQDNRPSGAAKSYVENGNDYVWGFAASTAGGDGGLAMSSWEVGDPYGVEIARIDLPRGYIFGNSAPSGNKMTSASVGAASFDAEQLDPDPSASVPVSRMQSNSGGSFTPKLVGTATSSMLKDTSK